MSSNGEEKLDKTKQLSTKKKAFIEAWIRTFGNVTKTCKHIGIGRTTYYYWLDSDPVFKEVIESEDTNEKFLDFLEDKLIDQVRNGNTAALIFALKTKGRKRGYEEKAPVDVPDEIKLEVIMREIKPNGSSEN